MGSRGEPEVISLRDIVQVLWRRRWQALIFNLVLVVAAGIAAWLTPDKYDATILVSPVTTSETDGVLGGLGSLASEFGGLASLAGITLGADTKRAESLAVLQSQALTEKYISENNLLPVLFEDKWDAENSQWQPNLRKGPPTLWKANELFKEDIRDVETTKDGLIKLTIRWTDPQLAATWANGLVRMTNDYLRDKAIAESERNIAFLNEQAAKTDIVGARQAIFRILENEINQVMLARGREEYALKTLDPATAPEEPSSPKLVVWLLLALFSGILLCFFFALAALAWTKATADDTAHSR